MDVGDGSYQVRLAFFTLLSVYVHLILVIAATCGFLLRGQVQCSAGSGSACVPR